MSTYEWYDNRMTNNEMKKGVDREPTTQPIGCDVWTVGHWLWPQNIAPLMKKYNKYSNELMTQFIV